MFLRTIYERIQMNRIVNFKGNRAERHACASSNIYRMPHPITVWEPAGSQKNNHTENMTLMANLTLFLCRLHDYDPGFYSYVFIDGGAWLSSWRFKTFACIYFSLYNM
jgi:hypothetical protein